MKSTLTGFVLAAVLLAAAFVVPAFLPASTPSETLDALKQAELARRQLQAYDARLTLTAANADIDRLQEADFSAIAEASADDVAAIKDGFRNIIRNAQALDRRSGLPPSNIRDFSLNAGSVTAFEKAARDNNTLLSEASKNSTQASRAERNSAVVGQMAGAVKLVEAGGLLGESLKLRTLAAIEATRLMEVAAQWAQANAESLHYAGLDLSDVDETLTENINDVSDRLAEASKTLDACEQALAALRQELDEVQQQMKQRQNQLQQLSDAGFVTGDDASFQIYRDKYVSLSMQLRDLEAEAQLLAFGGLEGAEAADDDWFKGELSGGRPVVGISELEREAELLGVTVERLEKSRAALTNKQTAVATIGQEARTRKNLFDERLAALATEFAEIRSAAAVHAELASAKETAALQAAQAAVSAFKSEKSAVDRWKSEAGTLQREKDPQRLNERLKIIAADSMSAETASSNEAQALLMVGRIETERALAMREHLQAMDRAAALAPEFEIAGVVELRESASQARDEAVEALTAARDAYERLAQKQSDTSWAPQSSLAAVHHLLWRIDEFNAGQHRGAMIEQLGQVVEGRSAYPYLKQQVMLYTEVSGDKTRPAPQPREEAPVEEPEAETEDEG